MTERVISGRYVLKQNLAAGGMGTIWLALDTQLERHVALKLMSPHFLSSAGARQRFAQEAKAIARLHSPHVVQVYDYGIEDNAPYIVMELLEGKDFAALLKLSKRLVPAAVVPLLNQAARGLTAAHTAGVIHRDLKPGNLFLARIGGEEVVKVLDFGVALLDASTEVRAQEQEVLGTPRYMSPEQLRGQRDLDHRTDLWSLGVVLYLLLTGEYPFPMHALEALRRNNTPLPVRPPSSIVPELGAEMDSFFAQVFAAELAQRFSSARELAAAFSALVVAGRPIRAAKILAVDDEPLMAAVLQQRFREQIRAGLYEFIFASNGEEALERLRRHPDTDVVLLDLNMPKMDGLTFLSRVGEVHPFVKVIIVSAYSDMSNLRTAMNRGAFDFLVKPINFQDLKSTLEKTLKSVGELRRMLRSTEENEVLRMFVHSGVVDRALSAVRTPQSLAGETVESTVVFVDVKDFSPVIRTEPPETALRRLNAHFEAIVPELVLRGGVVDKFVGDAVMAVFRGQGHLERALDGCLAARQVLWDLAARTGQPSPYTHGISMGVDSGQILSGGIGAQALGRLDYTVLGDVVNRAAWLASLAGRDQLLICEAVRRKLDASFACSALGTRQLPGLGAPLAVYEVERRRKPEEDAPEPTLPPRPRGPGEPPNP